MSEPSREDIETAVRELRQEFNKNGPIPVAHRRHQISQLRKMMHENLPLLEAAIWKDLRKNAFDMYYMECAGIDEECQMALDEIESWVKPTATSINIANIPGSSEIRPEPHGVVLVLSTWNYPIMLSLQPLVGAFAAGNCVMLKVPPLAALPNLAELLVKLCHKYLDSRSFRVFGGDLEALKIMLEQRFDMFFYTGSTAVGKMVNEAAAQHFAKCLLELGGKNPTVVTPTANLSVSAKRIVWGAFTNCGQTCVRPDYLMVHSSIADELISLMKTAIKEFYEDSATSDWYGRLINANSVERMKSILESDSKFVITGGNSDVEDRYVEPTLLDFGGDFTAFAASSCMKGEIFGPLLPIVRYEDFDTCLEFIRQREKPLAAHCFCGDDLTKEQFTAQTSSGSCIINDVMMQLSNPYLPFGGVGKSGGGGKYHGRSSFDAFSHQKSVLKKCFFLDIKQRYPPLSTLDQKVRAVVQACIPKRAYTCAKVLLLGISIAIFRSIWRNQKARVLHFLTTYT